MNDAVRALLIPGHLMPLGPGTSNEALRPALADFRLANAADAEMAAACRAGLWLYHNFLDESHALSQEMDTPTGSFWHGILHRREPDAANAKYWFRRVGDHPVLMMLREQALSLGCNYTDPFVFIDFVERVRGTGSKNEEAAKLVQKLEWELLFDHCYRAAI